MDIIYYFSLSHSDLTCNLNQQQWMVSLTKQGVHDSVTNQYVMHEEESRYILSQANSWATRNFLQWDKYQAPAIGSDTESSKR